MNIGIFAKTFPRPTLAATLQAVREHDLNSVQFNLACAGLPTLPDALTVEQIQQMRQALEAHGITVAAISGTFNMAHPDAAERARNLVRLNMLASACQGLGTQIITLCTGTRDRQDMWRRHPDNDTPEAWHAMADCISQALQIAEDRGVVLAFEPEVSNVVDTAAKGRRLLDEMRSPRLKVVMDGANLFHQGELPRMAAILPEAFDLLAGDMVLAHAKDLSHDGEAGHEAAGTGALDYDLYLRLLSSAGYTGPLILHSLSEAQVDAAVAFLRAKLSPAGPAH